jgi:cytochrome b561
MVVRGYSRTQIILHWATVVLVALQYLLHEGIADAFEEGLEAGRMALSAPVIGHMVGGSLILLLAFWRLALRQERGAPPPPASDPPWQRALARTVHRGMYALILLLPVSGAVAWAQASVAASAVHEAMRALLLVLILVHVAGALWGQFVQGTGVLARMLRPGG